MASKTGKNSGTSDASSGEPIRREKDLKWNGWGYKDSFFYVNEKKEVSFTGERYDVSGKILPNLRPWMVENLGIDLDHKTPSQMSIPSDLIPSPTLNQALLDFLDSHQIPHSTESSVRVNRAHGHTVHDIWMLRQGTFKRIPDVVIWPRNQDEVIKLVKAADQYGCVIIPIGGGTSVSNALDCPKSETRCIISLDMCKMNRLLWVDEKNLTARAEAGIIGIDLEEKLKAKGFTMGHEPDSIEFSSLGGWVATRASGMKKNRYGNIEDLLVHVSVVTPRGLVQKSCQVPRISAGPDIHHFILGSEGTLGVVTEVTFKVCHVPPVKRFGSIIFPAFEPGVKCLREVALKRIAPSSIRLVDNEQFAFGQALKPAAESYWQVLKDKAKKLYVTKWKGFEPKEMCVATLMFEGDEEAVAEHEKKIYSIAASYGGLAAGEENGRYGYMLTFAIAYLRDLGFEYSCLGESFETSVPWDKVLNLCRNVKELLQRETKRHGVVLPILASCRVTQVYDSGVCVYFYFGFNYRGMPGDPLEVYDDIETAARNEILACGGSISHHHGVGKLRKRYLPDTVGETGVGALQAVKRYLDPNNVFANGNLFSVPKI